MRFLEFLLILVLVAALGGVTYYALGEARIAGQVPSLQAQVKAQRDADVQAAGAHEAACTTQVASALKAGAAIARISVPHARTSPMLPPMYSAADIRSAMQ